MKLFRQLTYRVEEVTHPLGNDEGEHDGNTECDVSSTLDHDHSQRDGHAHCTSQLAACSYQSVLGYICALILKYARLVGVIHQLPFT